MRDALFVIVVTAVMAAIGGAVGPWIAEKFYYPTSIYPTPDASQSAPLPDPDAEALAHRKATYGWVGAWFVGGFGLVVSVTAVAIRSPRRKSGHGAVVVTSSGAHAA